MGEQEKEDIEIESPDKDLQGQAEIKRLNLCLEQKTKEAEAAFDKFLRACADLENYKKRAEKEKGELISFSNERFIKEVLPVVDNLERAIDHIEDESDLAAVKDGIKLVLDNLLAVLKKFGVEAASAMGDKFDPTRHEAISQEEILNSDPGTIIKEFHKGYYLNGRLLRPAMVVIAKATEKSKEKEETEEGRTEKQSQRAIESE
ncbi:MAG: nucleotide exchange factor GrpE [Deltaproteobacteria bacterium]|nr:nucleotide exchange factor GrpE [Deltaproteobacteria bacterium]